MNTELQSHPKPTRCDAPVVDARVVLLTHYIPIYQLPIYQELSRQIRDFHVLLSTDVEPNRHFQPRWEGLDVTLQKTLTLQRRWRHSAGFDDTLYVHVPYDTGRQLRRLQPDIVLSLELGFRSLASSLHRILHRRSKLILCTYMSQHTEQGRGMMRAAARRWLIGRADAITYNGPSCFDVLSDLGADPKRLFHFPYAANPASIYTGKRQPSGSPSVTRMLYIGQMTQRKGVEAMVEQVVRYAQQHAEQAFQLTMVGEGPLREPLSAVATPANLAIEFTGNLPSEQLPTLMPAHDLLIFPTLADEWGLVVNEALHSGLPVIGSLLAQASTTLLQDDRNGWLYDPRDDSGLAGCLDRWLACDVAARASMAGACRDSVRDRTPAFAASGLIDACQFVMGYSTNKRCDD
ncbi:glycosyltransferase family 4 protein [Rosistilla oblonga]|uniref:glycosyltransferase family 4 protein n=1 Tax=Rosistilla oblonga TaxID=2527990 RepID=UPI003A984AE8